MPDLPAPLLPEEERAEIQSTTARENVETALGYFSLSAIGSAMNRAGWTVEEDIEHSVNIARNTNEKASDRLRAMEGIRKVVADAVDMVKEENRVERTYDSQGQLKEVESTQRLTASLIDQNLLKEGNRFGLNIVEPLSDQERTPQGLPAGAGKTSNPEIVADYSQGVADPEELEP